MKYFILMLSLVLFSCSSKTKKCEKFKTGTFEYIDNNNTKQTVIRNDSIQIEFNDKDNIKIMTSVVWVSDCEYVLTYKDIENYLKKDNVIGKQINVEIIETNNNTYICHAVSDSMDSKIEMVKVSQ